jgi:iron complex outermembrane receptor protein
VFNQFDMPLARDPLGLTATQLANDATQAGTNAIARQTRKTVLQNQLGTSLTHEIDPDRAVTARVYYGTRDNTQYQTGLAASTGAWVGLNRAYYGLGLQYNEKTTIGATPVRWATGYEFDRSREFRQGGATALGVITTTTRSEDNQAENGDVFAQATALVSEHISLTGGLRYSTVRFVSDDYYLSDGNGSGNTSYSATSPVLGVTWHVSDTVNLYANYGKGFETPTLAEMAYNSTGLPSFNTSLNAASSQHYEMGAKWAPDSRSRVDFTVFQINTTDEIVVASSTGGNSTYKNAPGTSRTGWELAGRRLLNPNWRATLSASAIDAQFSQTFTSSGSTVLAGNKMPGIPQYYVFTELLWTGQAMDDARRKPLLDTQAGVELVSAGRMYVNDTNFDSVAKTATQADGYTTLNLKASHGWAAGKGILTAYGRLDNVTDQRYVGSVIVNQMANQFYEPAPGFNWTLGLRLNVPL